MKKVLAVIIAYFLFTQITFSQSRYSAGIEAGASFVTLSGNDIVEEIHNTATRMMAGGFIQVDFLSNANVEGKKISNTDSDNFFISLRTGIRYEDKGSRSALLIFTDDMGNSLGTGRVHTHLNYITVPVLVRATIGRNLKYFINAGPYAGFLLNARSKFRGPAIEDISEESTDLYKSTDFGVAGGLGLLLPLNNINISLEIRENFGLSNINDQGDAKMRTNAFNIMGGISFNL